MWTGIQIVLGILGALLAVAGIQFSIPIFSSAGLICIGWLALAIGWEAIITQHIVLGQKSRGTSEPYSGAAAMMQGNQFNILGLFLIGNSVMAYLDSGERIFQSIIRRPGMTLIIGGVLCLLQAMIAFFGAQEYRQGDRWAVMHNILASRLLPGVVLTGLGLGALGLGAFELIAPGAFDQMGGGFLETLFLR